MMPKSVVRPKAAGNGKLRFGLIIDSNGSGIKSNRKAMVEKDEPVGVKFIARAKSNGRYRPKNESRLIKETTIALP